MFTPATNLFFLEEGAIEEREIKDTRELTKIFNMKAWINDILDKRTGKMLVDNTKEGLWKAYSLYAIPNPKHLSEQTPHIDADEVGCDSQCTQKKNEKKKVAGAKANGS